MLSKRRPLNIFCVCVKGDINSYSDTGEHSKCLNSLIELMQKPRNPGRYPLSLCIDPPTFRRAKTGIFTVSVYVMYMTFDVVLTNYARGNKTRQNEAKNALHKILRFQLFMTTFSNGLISRNQ